jgi:hypothetical protein
MLTNDVRVLSPGLEITYKDEKCSKLRNADFLLCLA